MRDRLLVAHGLVDTLVGSGLSPGSAFRLVGEVLSLDEDDERWPPFAEVRFGRESPGVGLVLLRPEHRRAVRPDGRRRPR